MSSLIPVRAGDIIVLPNGGRLVLKYVDLTMRGNDHPHLQLRGSYVSPETTGRDLPIVTQPALIHAPASNRKRRHFATEFVYTYHQPAPPAAIMEVKPPYRLLLVEELEQPPTDTEWGILGSYAGPEEWYKNVEKDRIALKSRKLTYRTKTPLPTAADVIAMRKKAADFIIKGLTEPATEETPVNKPPEETKQWSLPEPPQGMQWHKAKHWLERFLQFGYRPLLINEALQEGDEMGTSGDMWIRLSASRHGEIVSDMLASFYRTTRPLPIVVNHPPSPISYGLGMTV
jgi:hypothetical protein